MDHTGENERWGRYGEWVMRYMFNLTEDRAQWKDASDQHGNPYEGKFCKLWVGERGDPGKYFIRYENHQKLREEDGFYVFGLYDPMMWKHGPVLAVEMKPATWLDEVDTYAWTDNGSRRGETVFRPPWTAIFDAEGIPSVVMADAGETVMM